MNSLRQKMTEEMVLKGFAANTQITYLYHITQLARFFHRPPDKISEDGIRQYLLNCHQVKHWSYSSCRQFIHAARFFYDKVLLKPLSKARLPLPKKEEKIPELLSRSEVAKIIGHCFNPKFQVALKLAYATGLRVSEVVALRVRDLDGERNVIRVLNSKGNKDREIEFTESVKKLLRHYWREYCPQDTLFYSQNPRSPLSKATLQRAYTAAKLKAEVHKTGGIHGLRHAYATHQLEGGMSLPQLQQQLGHKHISCTLRYTRWLRYAPCAAGDTFDLLYALEQDES